jgi:hypothetical protein
LNIGLYNAKKLRTALETFIEEKIEEEEVKLPTVVEDIEHAEEPIPEEVREEIEGYEVEEEEAVEIEEVEGVGKLEEIEDKRCKHHNNLAVARDRCGAYLCRLCLQEKLCPICYRPIVRIEVRRTEKRAKEEKKEKKETNKEKERRMKEEVLKKMKRRATKEEREKRNFSRL